MNLSLFILTFALETMNSSLMKILFYADTVFGFGGVQRVLAVIAKALSDEHDVTILSTDTDVNLSMYGYKQSNVKFDYGSIHY